jgi:hypothetical protein
MKRNINDLLGPSNIEDEGREDEQKPYLEETYIRKLWNPRYNQDASCVCGHRYERHFDGYEDMKAVGCKFCECREFLAA